MAKVMPKLLQNITKVNVVGKSTSENTSGIKIKTIW